MRIALRRHTGSMSFAILFFTVIMASTAFAQFPGRHPAYLHARTDLVRARILMELPEERNVAMQLRSSIQEVNAAIGEIDAAARWDRKEIDERPVVDVRLHGHDKYREIARLLRSAQHDIDHEEDSPMARAWRNRASRHIDDSVLFLRRAKLINDADDLRFR